MNQRIKFKFHDFISTHTLKLVRAFFKGILGILLKLVRKGKAKRNREINRLGR